MKRWMLIALWLGLAGNCFGEPLVRFDFTDAQTMKAWRAGVDVGKLTHSAQGLVIPITGGDPSIIGPAMDLPADQPLWLSMRYTSLEAGTLQIFFFDKGANETQSVRVGGKSGVNEVKVPLPSMGKGYRLRIDPPGTQGETLLAWIEIERRVPLAAPRWPMMDDAPTAGGAEISSGELKLHYAPGKAGRFDVLVAGQLMARGYNAPAGYVAGHAQKWVGLRTEAGTIRSDGAGLVVQSKATDADGGVWEMQQRWSTGKVEGALQVETTVTISEDRHVTFLPLLLLSAGSGSFGEHKTQALFSGLEYLDRDEPSSSEADIIGPGAKRQVPDTLKITIPLMTVAAQERYVAVSWTMDDAVAAVFDSPDRIFKTGGSMMGLIAPGSNGFNRDPDNVLPHWPMKMSAGKPMVVKAMVLGGKGQSAVNSVSKYIVLNPLPPLPKLATDLQGYIANASAGWLDSKIREGAHYAHAWPGAFKPHAAADAAFYMRWLIGTGAPEPLAARLKEASDAAIKEVNPAVYSASGIGHVRWPLGALVYGNVAQNSRQMRDAARGALKRFEADGSINYRPTKEWDFGKTHFAPDANGLTATVVVQVLTAAAVSGDAQLKEEGLRLLRCLNKFDNTVPRGAQTWEMPLHCPDILASAYLIKAYVLGYQMTGDEELLARARYWAWTGVPFIYLRNPAGNAVGPYASIVCLGATHWRGMNWMGLPVQWCGLVHAESLYRLAEFDSQGPWNHLADGIVISGMQQNHPAKTPLRGGLLPDSYMLREEKRNDAAINPGTVQANAGRAYGLGPMYDFAVVRDKGWMIHAPGRIEKLKSDASGAEFSVRPWMKDAYYVLAAGCSGKASVKVNGTAIDKAAIEHTADGLMILKLQGTAMVEIRTN